MEDHMTSALSYSRTARDGIVIALVALGGCGQEGLITNDEDPSGAAALTAPTSISISPPSGAMQSGSTLQFTPICKYSTGQSDNCQLAGGASWSSSRPSSVTVSSSGLATWITDPGAGKAALGVIVLKAGGRTDRADVFGQHPGDTWYLYPTPDARNFSGGVPTFVVGSTIAVGEGLEINHDGANGSQPTGQPYTACSFVSSNPAVATVTRYGLVTAVAPGQVTISCAIKGNARFGNSAIAGWVAPGNAITFQVTQGSTAAATTWYVRPDGGTPFVSATQTPNGQCNGKVNAPYPGSGVNQPCAMGNIRYLWADGVTWYKTNWMIAGGDTVIVAPNANGYNTGIDAVPQTGVAWSPVNCSGTASCSMPSIPSGTAQRHTRILGANYANCSTDSAKTLLNVSFGGYTAFNLTGSQFVDVSCFEVHDKAACAVGNFTNTCSGKNWGHYGITQSAMTGNVNYTDLFIHGLAVEGIRGPTGGNVVMNRVHVRGNPTAGIDMDDLAWSSGNISVAGGLTMNNSITEFSGCVEEFPVVHNYPYIECRDQTTGAYGDGFGTASTTGSWSFNNDIWRYNFSDGLDLLHSGMQSLIVLNSQSYGNDGQALKIGSGQYVHLQNNIVLDNCARILATIGDEPASAIVPGVTACRAAGDWVPMSFDDQGEYLVQNNTFAGYGSTPFDLRCAGGWDSCIHAATAFENNVVVGIQAPTRALPGLFYLSSPSTAMPPNGGWGQRNHNLYYNLKSCPTLLSGEKCVDPKFVSLPYTITSESQLDNVNFKPATSSPLLGAGLATGITADIFGAARPTPPSIGAVE
jgi:hypothetical protein